MRKYPTSIIAICSLIVIACMIPLTIVGCRGFYDPQSVNVDNASLQKEIVKDRERLDLSEKNFKSLEQLVLNNQCKCPKDMVSCQCGENHKPGPARPKVLGWYKDTAKDNIFYYGYVQDKVLYYSYLYHPDPLSVKRDFDKVELAPRGDSGEVKK